MKSCYVSFRKNPAVSPENKKNVTREKARASVNTCLLHMSKSNIHCEICFSVGKKSSIVSYINEVL